MNNSDSLKRILLDSQSIDKAKLEYGLKNSESDPDMPGTLILLCHAYIDNIQTESVLNYALEQLSLENAITNIEIENQISYIPAPGYEDAISLCPWDQYMDLPPEHQRQMGYVTKSKNPKLLILTPDPSEATKLSQLKNLEFWNKKAKNLGYENLKPIFGLTGIREFTQFTYTKKWTQGTSSPTLKQELEIYNLDCYKETATTAYCWQSLEDSQYQIPIKRLREKLCQLNYKEIRTIPRIYPNHTGGEKISAKFMDIKGHMDPTSQRLDTLWKKIRKDAIFQEASDIHIQPNTDGGLIVLSREGGHLTPKATIGPSFRDKFYKIVCRETGIDPLEKIQTPKDARASIHPSEFGRRIDMRYGIMPGGPPMSKPKIVIRIFDSKYIRRGIDEICQEPKDRETWSKILSLSEGLTIINGPTGSGKSVTLYAALQTLHRDYPFLAIQTLEDPLEYIVGDWLHQSQINVDVGAGFNDLMRFILRTDPDAAMLGEMRDEETAKMAVKFALSGHRLLSTLHADNSIAVISRMQELHVNLGTLSQTFKASIAQRLTAEPCMDCAVEVPANSETLSYGGNIEDTYLVCKGCPKCKDRGSKKRFPVQEFCLIENEVEADMVKRNDTVGLRAAMDNKGLFTLDKKIWNLAKNHKIPLKEAMKLTGKK